MLRKIKNKYKNSRFKGDIDKWCPNGGRSTTFILLLYISIEYTNFLIDCIQLIVEPLTY